MNSNGSNDNELLLTLEECATRLSMSIRTIYREIAAGHFPRPVKIRRLSRVPVSALEAYVRWLAGSKAKS
jgi:excisionase family DNA binding protein